MFIVLSLFTLYLAMLGSAVIPLPSGAGSLRERAALALALGILVNYCLMLTGQSIGRVLLVGTILAILGLLRLGRNARTGLPNRARADGATVFSLCCIGYILVVFYFKILCEPLSRWDARSIWFLHAKMIWVEGALRQQAGWNHPSLAFSSPDYPKLVPAIAAQLAYIKGYWNEFLPKGSLLVMLVPAVLWVFSFFKARVSFVLLSLALFFSLPAWLWTGYMDGYLAIYCGVAVLLFGRYLAERRNLDLYSGLSAAGIAANIKNEGLFFGLCLVIALFSIGIAFRASNGTGRVRWPRADFAFSSVLLVSIAPALMWGICKKAWGLQNVLTAAFSETWSRLWTRLFDGFSAAYVLHFLTIRASSIWIVIALIAATLLFLAHQGLKPHRAALVAAMTAVLYTCGLYVIYLSTPAELHWHLWTAAARTMAAGMMALFVSMFFFLSGLEVDEGRT